MKMTALVLGVLLFVVALVFGGLQLLHIYNIYGPGSNKWYFYGAVGTIGIIGIILAAWGIPKEKTEQANP